MATQSRLVQGTLEMLSRRMLLFGPAHGHPIAKCMQRTCDDVLQVESGSLYPALHWLETRGWITGRWETSEEQGRDLRFYRLTLKGRAALAAEEANWKKLSRATARVMRSSETA